MGIHDDGASERLDLAAACELAAFVSDDVPVVLAGYSFGAAVSLDVVHSSVVGWLCVAPPVSMLKGLPVAASSHLPKVILVPEHDQFSSVEDAAALATQWRNTSVTVLAGVDHFVLAGADSACAGALAALLQTIGL